MAETKDRQIMVNIENTYYIALLSVVESDRATMSGYIRNLIIEELLRRNAITSDTIAQVVLGRAS